MKNKSEKSITIAAVIPAYNCEKYIARAIESILSQTHPVDEIIVVDDGSTDGTADIINSFGEKVHYIYRENGGECNARNTGIQAASSAWFAFLDADDEWLPEKIEKQVECLFQNDSLMWLASNYTRCLCGTGRQSPHMPEQKARAYLKGRTYYPDYFQAFIWDAHGYSSTMMVHKDVFAKAGMFRPNQKRGGDVDMWWRIAYRYPQIGYVPEPLTIYHIGIPDSASVLYTDWKIYQDMIERHLKEAEELGQLHRFRPVISRSIKLWLRSMLFKQQKEAIQVMMKEFKHLLSFRYRVLMSVLIICPPLTAAILKMISIVSRKLRLRTKLVRQ